MRQPEGTSTSQRPGSVRLAPDSARGTSGRASALRVTLGVGNAPRVSRAPPRSSAAHVSRPIAYVRRPVTGGRDLYTSSRRRYRNAFAWTGDGDHGGAQGIGAPRCSRGEGAEWRSATSRSVRHPQGSPDRRSNDVSFFLSEVTLQLADIFDVIFCTGLDWISSGRSREDPVGTTSRRSPSAAPPRPITATSASRPAASERAGFQHMAPGVHGERRQKLLLRSSRSRATQTRRSCSRPAPPRYARRDIDQSRPGRPLPSDPRVKGTVSECGIHWSRTHPRCGWPTRRRAKHRTGRRGHRRCREAHGGGWPDTISRQLTGLAERHTKSRAIWRLRRGDVQLSRLGHAGEVLCSALPSDARLAPRAAASAGSTGGAPLMEIDGLLRIEPTGRGPKRGAHFKASRSRR